MTNHHEIVVQDEHQRKQKNETFFQKISVEVSLFLYMMAFMITTVVENAFFVYKSCTVNHNFTHEICINIQNFTDINKEVQMTTATFLQYNSIAGHVIPIILAFFMGSFSDKRGR
jgi:MFS transporter, PCFT/HCP family, solute carrier family 46, member 3